MQRINGVFSGGGLKGFALAGAVQEFERQGYIFEHTAGTSAGAVIAAFLAAGYKGDELVQILSEDDFESLLDPRKTMLPFPFMKWVSLYWRMGLYKGDALENWFYDKLAQKDCYTFGDLRTGSLKCVASDLTNGKMIVLPDDLPAYGYDPENFPIAKALRMSCSIPYFFEPVRLASPAGAVTVDGGVLSNFPMWLFDADDAACRCPLVGFKLSSSKADMPGRKICNALQLFEALFAAMKNAHDERYISRKHEKQIVFIPVEQYSAVQFDLNEEQIEDLLETGRRCAQQFLLNETNKTPPAAPKKIPM